MGASDPCIQSQGEKTVVCRHDPADFAYRIRALATDAGRALRNVDTAPRELIELSERFDELLRGTQDKRANEIDRWLRNAQNLIESRRRSV
jgi:hypothetical protein